MAQDKTIGQLDDGATVRATDQIPVERDGGNARVVIGTAGTRAASDPDLDAVASVNGATTVGHLAVFSDTAGSVEDGGAVGAIITDATLLDLILTTDFLPVVRGGVIYLATVEDVLAAQPPAGEGGQFDFSDAQNSAYAAII